MKGKQDIKGKKGQVYQQEKKKQQETTLGKMFQNVTCFVYVMLRI